MAAKDFSACLKKDIQNSVRYFIAHPGRDGYFFILKKAKKKQGATNPAVSGCSMDCLPIIPFPYRTNTLPHLCFRLSGIELLSPEPFPAEGITPEERFRDCLNLSSFIISEVYLKVNKVRINWILKAILIKISIPAVLHFSTMKKQAATAGLPGRFLNLFACPFLNPNECNRR